MGTRVFCTKISKTFSASLYHCTRYRDKMKSIPIIIISSILTFSQLFPSLAFTPIQPNLQQTKQSNVGIYSKNSDNEEESKFEMFAKPFLAVADMFQNLDDVIDDFYNKRMGNGEIFYGKRKYKPSGTVDGDYNGFGLSDFQKIEMTKEAKEAWLEERELRKEMEALRRSKDEK